MAIVPRIAPPRNHLTSGLALAVTLALAAACQDPDQAADDGTTTAVDPDPGTDPTRESTDPATSGTDDTGGDLTDGGEQAATLDLPAIPYSYADPDLPEHFLTPLVRDLDNTPVDNPVTDAGATLGRVLFYDTALSKNLTVACASCHQQEHGFSDPDGFSEGFAGGSTGRNSMGLANARWYASGRFFWDERAATLEEQVLQPIQNEVEMGLTLDELIARVDERDYYDDLFTAAFGDDLVTADRISRALAQFVRAMISYRSRFDLGLAETGSIAAEFAGFSAAENHGKAIFVGPRGGCVACHLAGPPPPPPGMPFPNQAIFQPVAPINNGLDAGPVTEDNGVGDVSGEQNDLGLFKSPSLRDIAVSAPYMHDGRFATLAEVIEFYDNGVQPHPNLDPRLRGPGGQPRRLDLSDAEKSALAAFLATLTDEALRADPRFADPFVR